MPRMKSGPLAAICAVLTLAAGCATGPDPRDPYEPFNRSVYKLNDGLDRAVVQPTARAYRAVLPAFVQTSIGNVLSNVGDVKNVVNKALQGEFRAAYANVGRVLMNSTLGVGGLFDIASAAGVEKDNEDFGQTLGVWGVGRGSYLVLPLIGPSSTRDALGRVADYATDPLTYTGVGIPVRATEAIDTRSQLLEASALMNASALDPYLFMRDAYLQRRDALVRNGRPAPLLEERQLADGSE